ncbi:ArnT family glycosyltransferase [Methanothrix soehngenii]|uniref:ArnT family glycosyltransferase n=1 Tax=Methanothrix soehngenii TaxID=2223 RepID=UPI00300CB838
MKELNVLKTYYPILMIVLASFVIRMFLRSSNYLDDWDSVQFILGLNNYSMVARRPHPPGYPVYIFVRRIVDQFFNCGLESFTFMSSLFGSLALIPTFLLAKEFFGYRVGILSAIILSLAPAEMLFSEVVMSDIVSMFFITATVYFLYRGIKSSKYLYLGAFILAVTIGVRQTDLPLIIMLLSIRIYISEM